METTELLEAIFTVLEESGSSLFSLFSECFVYYTYRGISQETTVKTVSFC